MTPVQVKALQRYISAVAYFMMTRGEGINELLASRDHLETCFTLAMPDVPQPKPSAFPDIL